MKVITDPPIVPQLQAMLNNAAKDGTPVVRIEVTRSEYDVLRQAKAFVPSGVVSYGRGPHIVGRFQGERVVLVDE